MNELVHAQDFLIKLIQSKYEDVRYYQVIGHENDDVRRRLVLSVRRIEED